MIALSPRQYRWTMIGFTLLFFVVVAMGWVPGWYRFEGKERLLFGLFALSPLDDITHGVTALACGIAAWQAGSWMRSVYVTFGSYYALDAIFFLLYGFVNEKTWVQDLALNAPHVGISAAMLFLAYGTRLASPVADSAAR